MNTCRVDKWLLTVLLNCISKYVVVFTKYVSSLSLYSLCKQLVAYAFRGDRDEGGAQGDTVPGIPHRAGAAGLTLGAPAVDRGGMPQSPSQTSRTGKPKKAIDGLSQGDSIGSLEKEGSDVSWHTSEEELDFTPKKLQKPNLTLLMNVSQQFRKNTGKSPRLESQRPNSVCLEQVDDEDTEEEQCEVDNKVCEALKQEREHLCLNRHDENVRAAFHSGTKEKSPEQEEEEKEQEKEDTGEELQTAVVEGVKNSICNDSHQVHSASKDNTGERSALTAVGAEEEEDAESPWDSETDSESPEEGSPGVLLPAADRHGARSRIVSGERQTGFLEKPNNSQLKAPESVLERSETSPNKKQQKSDLLEEFGLGDAEDVEGENSGSTFHMSSSAEKDNVKDAIEYYGVQVEKEKSKRRISKVQAVAKQECLGKLNIPSDNITNRQMKQKITVRKNDCLKMENENTLEEKDKKSFSSEESSKLIKMPMKCKMALNAKVAKKSRRQPSKQKAHQQMSSSSGNHGQVRDDGTSSETSEDEGRPAATTGSEKSKVSIPTEVTDDPGLTHSSDPTSEDVELRTSTYKEAMLLLEQLRVDHTGSAILLKLQNILLEYEQRIERGTNRYTALSREVRELEDEKRESRFRAEKTQDLKSILAHQEAEWKSDIQSLKCSLKQEEAKRLRVEVLCEKVREKLQRKEDQYCKEREGKQKLELHSRNLEMEIRTLRKLLKRVEEERDETQTQRSQEKSARALQEGILNNHLGRQMELEEETRRSIGKNSEESNTEREKDLLYKNQLLQDEIAVLRLEINQVRLKHQEEEGKSLEENETLKEKNEALKKELKLNKEALTQTVLQYNAQLDFLKTESAVLTSKLEQTNESKDRLEAEIKSFHSRLNAAVQELERHRSSEKDAEQRFHRERDEWHRLQGKLHHDLSDTQETNKSLSQQLCKAESKANRLENELHQLEQTLREKTLLVEMTQKELSQAQRQAKECDRAQQLEKDPVSELVIKQESLQERLAQLQSENLFLRQQLEDAQSKRIMKAEVVNDVQDRFNDTLNKLRADTEKQVYLIEERNKDLNAKCTDLREQVFKYETDKVERECESERKEVKKLVELKRPAELRLDQEMKRNLDLQKDCKSLLCRLKRLLSRATKELRVYEERGGLSQLNLQGEMKNRYSEMVNEIGRLRTKVDELSQQLEIESKKGMQLEAQNHDLREELSTMRGNHEELEKSKSQLKEEVANLKHHMETNMVDRSQIEQYKREVEERAAQEIRQKLQEVNLILQGSGRREYGWARCFHVRAVCLQALNQKLAKMQAASQDRLEQIRASHHALLTSQLEQRIGDLERELDRIKNTQRDSTFQKESAQAEVEKYKDLYLEEVKNGRCLANKLERANERLAEANAELLQECHRSKPLIASSAVSGPVLYSAELGHISNNPALNRSLNLGGSFLTPTGNTLPSRNRVEAYVAKVRQELDERIAKELKQATAELEAGSAGASPVVFSDGSSKSIHVDQDPLCRAVQEYRDVLTKNYLI
ncbi:ankyrin repeat domain-containing protein 26 isoform X15 [Falco rusticolus]|uniref:ankyrin repeat domain-containing protein 26 isoform X15 n=1 Tax=Falco rusticolus TaxID=120794 RepID=UPI001886A8C6|nr:ankyrin repeat domain-containing protein 26 isoform X15 [Falco rusticolus]